MLQAPTYLDGGVEILKRAANPAASLSAKMRLLSDADENGETTSTVKDAAEALDDFVNAIGEFIPTAFSEYAPDPLVTLPLIHYSVETITVWAIQKNRVDFLEPRLSNSRWFETAEGYGPVDKAVADITERKLQQATEGYTCHDVFFACRQAKAIAIEGWRG